MSIRCFSFFELFFVLALATKPLYLLKSGSVQISDFLFVLTIFAMVFSEGKVIIESYSKRFLRVFLIIIIYQIIINLIGPMLWNPAGQYNLLFKVNLYYIFNFIVCFCVFNLIALRGYSRTVSLFIVGTVLSIFISLLGVFMSREHGRISGFFNNPNQLGYFCVVVLTTIVIYKKRLPIWLSIICIIICTYMTILSLSKAAIVSIAFIFVLYFNEYDTEINLKKMIFTFIGIGVAFLIIYFLLYSDFYMLSKFQYISLMRNRILGMMLESDSELSMGRGYARINEIGVLVLCGVGEGMFDRFISMTGFECHSAYASILVSYGIICAIIYAYLFKFTVYSKKYSLRYTVLFTSIGLYNITHMGLRSTLLWALLAMSYYQIKLDVN